MTDLTDLYKAGDTAHPLGDLDDEALAVLAQLTETCSGADLERFVVRARQEVLLAHLRARDTAGDTAVQSRAAHDFRILGTTGAFSMQLALEIWNARASEQSADWKMSEEQSSGMLRPALVHFIDSHTQERPSARVVSALTGIPASTVARIRQQRDRSDDGGRGEPIGQV
jgi:hypothetical protein